MMRSSIACVRCRRSKVKCLNNGVGTTCRACENSARECTYPPPVVTGTRRRDSIPGRTEGQPDGERRPRPRKSTQTTLATPVNGTRESPRPLNDALDATLLTSAVWQELFDIFQVHYAADLPFLHPPTFLKPLRQTSMLPPVANSIPGEIRSAPKPPGSPAFLLCFLTLTARYHPKLVAHHSPPTPKRPSNPLIASEYYAAAANERLVTCWTENNVHDIEHTQALLMLGLHEWGMCRGAKAWLMIGIAIRAAQAMGLQCEHDLDDEPLSKSFAWKTEDQQVGLHTPQMGATFDAKPDQDAFVEQEIRRRTFWSCYIMDRYLSSGKYRPQMLHAKELRIQLPASERSFLFAEKVRTLMLSEDDRIPKELEGWHGRGHKPIKGSLVDGAPPSAGFARHSSTEEKGRLEIGADEGLVSRYIKMLEIYGKVMQWLCAGGRRLENLPPWDSESEWYRLHQLCIDFKASLPRQHILTPQNTQAHISVKTSTPYTLIHTVYLLCLAMLHREFMPFLPLRCAKPEGPLDPPVFSAAKYEVPTAFWEDSARELVRSARGIIDLVSSCQEWNVLVETPIIGFALYIVAFVGVYCINFPWMDPDGYLRTRSSATTHVNGETSLLGESQGFVSARKALEMIGQMRPRLRMANGWFTTINRMHRYMRHMKSEFFENVQSSNIGSLDAEAILARKLSVREGELRGEVDEWKLFERTLNDFSNTDDQDTAMADTNLRPDSQATDPLYETSSTSNTVKSEDRKHVDAGPEQAKSNGGPWTAINAVSITQATQTSTPNSAQFRSYDSYPSQYQSTSQPLQYPPSSLTQLQQHAPAFSHHHSTFHSAYPPEAPALPNLASTSSHTASAPSQPSPSYDRPASASYSNWTPHNQTYPPPPPAPPAPLSSAHSNSLHHSQHSTPHHDGSGYATPQHISGPQLHHPSNQPAQELRNNTSAPTQREPFQKDAWLNSLPTRLSADDLAAFVDGGDIADWVSRDCSGQPGWLKIVWSGGNHHA